METSIFIAKFLGVIYFIFGLGILLNTKFYKKLLDSMMKDMSNLYFGGIMALVVGFLLIYYHNIWEMSWVVVITILGWIALFKGFLLIVFPESMISWTKSWTKSKELMPFWGGAMILLALLFGYFGFFTQM